MPETSRECIVLLPDESQFTVPVQPSLLAGDLLSMAASHGKIKEKSYFGLMTEGDGYKNWLEPDKPVLDPSQEMAKGTDTIKIFFSFKYFVDTYQDLQDHVTVEMLYLHCRRAIEKSEIITDEETIFELAALVMQATYGEFKTEEEALKLLQGMPVIPAYVFQQQSIKACEEQVISYYRMLDNYSRGETIFRYLEVVQSLAMYSYHYFEVKDKSGNQLWLGVGPNGIVQCPYENRMDPTMHYQWINLQNIYYKDKKFSVEVYSTNSRSTRKTGYQSSQVTLLSWYGKNSKVVMAIWKMVRDQHIFYREQRTAKGSEFGISDMEGTRSGMSTSEILRHLNHRHRHGGSISPSSSQSSLSIESAKSNQTSTASAEAVAAAKKAHKEMYSALLTKREMLVGLMEEKLARYKDLLLKEMQITGVPPEGLTAEEIEKMRTKFGINFKFSKFVLGNSGAYEGHEIEELEKQLEVQTAIIEATKSLVDQAKNRQIKKDRKKEVKMAEDKLHKLQEQLSRLKSKQKPFDSSRYPSDAAGFPLPPPSSFGLSGNRSSMRHSSPTGMAVDDSYLGKVIFEDSSCRLSPLITSQRLPLHKSTSALHDVSEMPRPRSPASGHFPLAGTQSLVYPSHSGSLLTPDTSRSFSTFSDGDPSALMDYDNSPRASFSSLPGSHSEDCILQGSNTAEDLIHRYSRDRQHSPSYGFRKSSDPSHRHTSPHLHHPRSSSPDVSSNSNSFRSSFASAGPFSPDVGNPGSQSFSSYPSAHQHYSSSVPHRQMRPSSGSIQSTPPNIGMGSDAAFPRRVSAPLVGTIGSSRQSTSSMRHGSSYLEKEMDLQEALLMDPQDEGTLV